jgi:hypothetical protein
MVERNILRLSPFFGSSGSLSSGQLLPYLTMLEMPLP